MRLGIVERFVGLLLRTKALSPKRSCLAPRMSQPLGRADFLRAAAIASMENTVNRAAAYG